MCMDTSASEGPPAGPEKYSYTLRFDHGDQIFRFLSSSKNSTWILPVKPGVGCEAPSYKNNIGIICVDCNNAAKHAQKKLTNKRKHDNRTDPSMHETNGCDANQNSSNRNNKPNWLPTPEKQTNARNKIQEKQQTLVTLQKCKHMCGTQPAQIISKHNCITDVVYLFGNALTKQSPRPQHGTAYHRSARSYQIAQLTPTPLSWQSNHCRQQRARTNSKTYTARNLNSVMHTNW